MAAKEVKTARESPRSPESHRLRSQGDRRQMRLVQAGGQWWHEGKAACALCRSLETFLKISSMVNFCGVLDTIFRACGKKRLIIKREILPIYSGILSYTAPALPHLPLPVLPTQPEQGWRATLPGAVQACRHLLLQY